MVGRAKGLIWGGPGCATGFPGLRPAPAAGTAVACASQGSLQCSMPACHTAVACAAQGLRRRLMPASSIAVACAAQGPMARALLRWLCSGRPGFVFIVKQSAGSVPCVYPVPVVLFFV